MLFCLAIYFYIFVWLYILFIEKRWFSGRALFSLVRAPIEPTSHWQGHYHKDSKHYSWSNYQNLKIFSRTVHCPVKTPFLNFLLDLFAWTGKVYFNSQRITSLLAGKRWNGLDSHLYLAKDPTNSAGWSLSISGRGSWQLKNSRSFSERWSYSSSAPTMAMNIEPTMMATPTYQRCS